MEEKFFIDEPNLEFYDYLDNIKLPGDELDSYELNNFKLNHFRLEDSQENKYDEIDALCSIAKLLLTPDLAFNPFDNLGKEKKSKSTILDVQSICIFPNSNNFGWKAEFTCTFLEEGAIKVKSFSAQIDMTSEVMLWSFKLLKEKFLASPDLNAFTVKSSFDKILLNGESETISFVDCNYSEESIIQIAVSRVLSISQFSQFSSNLGSTNRMAPVTLRFGVIDTPWVNVIKREKVWEVSFCALVSLNLTANEVTRTQIKTEGYTVQIDFSGNIENTLSHGVCSPDGGCHAE